MLIIDGPDMVGKTTLARAIVAELRSRDRLVTADHFGIEEAGYVPEQYMDRMDGLFWHVRDRMHMSELVYGTVHRGKSTLDADRYRQVDEAIKLMGGMVVLVCAERETYQRLVEKHHGRGEHYDVETNLRVGEQYWRLSCGETVGGVAPTIDMQWCVGTADGDLLFPSEDFINEVCDEYERRQMVMDRIIGDEYRLERYAEGVMRTESLDVPSIASRILGLNPDLLMLHARQQEEAGNHDIAARYDEEASAVRLTLACASERKIRLMHMLLGLQSEVGELADQLKKHIFYGRDLDWHNVAEELGDAAWYLTGAANVVGLETGNWLGEILDYNSRKLRVRYPNKFADQLAMARLDKAVVE